MTELETLREVLRNQRSFLRHWKADKDCGLVPSDDTLAEAARQIDAALASSQRHHLIAAE